MYIIPLLLLACQDSISTPKGVGYTGKSTGYLDEESKDWDEEFSSRLDCFSIDCYQVSFLKEEEKVFTLINDHRALEELPILRAHTALVEVARMHSEEMALGEVPFGHDGFEDRVDEILASFSHHSYEAAENVGMARGDSAAEEAVSIWLESQGHKRNIEGPFTLSGIGSYEHEGTIYFTQIFLDLD